MMLRGGVCHGACITDAEPGGGSGSPVDYANEKAVLVYPTVIDWTTTHLRYGSSTDQDCVKRMWDRCLQGSDTASEADPASAGCSSVAAKLKLYPDQLDVWEIEAMSACFTKSINAHSTEAPSGSGAANYYCNLRHAPSLSEYMHWHVFRI